MKRTRFILSRPHDPEKPPAAITEPFDCTTIFFTPAPDQISPVKVISKRPVELRCAIRFLTCHCTPVKVPPIKYEPSDTCVIAETVMVVSQLTTVVNVGSITHVIVRRTI